MSEKVYVQRKPEMYTDQWKGVCKARKYQPSQTFLVLDHQKTGYLLENLYGYWDSNSFNVVKTIVDSVPVPVGGNAVINPSHYDMMGANTIEILACAMTQAEWRGFCLGNTLKYRIRAGKKDALQQDIDKANNYERLYEEHKHLCRKE